METRAATAFTVLADAFGYPAPGRLEMLETGLSQMPAGGAQKAFARFVKKIRTLTLGAWEELHTRTLDLNPPAAPYVGFQTWGESYQRGQFLSSMSRVMAEARIDTDGELPDHLSPILLYLGQVEHPAPELTAVLGPAVARMLAVLSKSEPDNPYVDLLVAVQELCRGLK